MGEIEYRPVDEFLLMEGDEKEIKQVYNNFAYVLKQKRKNIHLQQERAAKFIGVSTNFLGDVERGIKFFSFPHMITAMHLFSITYDDFVFYDNSTGFDSNTHSLDIIVAKLDDRTKDALLESYMALVTQQKNN